ncbi:MAG: hypothetical protein AAFZ18_08110 [Myxococcota bacterium]
MNLRPPRRALVWVAPILVCFGCATTSVPPPPSLDPDRVAQVRAIDPSIAEELELLEWEAQAHAKAGDSLAAGRRARLARRILKVALSKTATCPEPRRPAPVASTQPDVQAPVSRPRKRKRRRAEVPPPPTAASQPATAPLEAELQSLAEKLRAFSPDALSPTDRVRLGSARQALVDAQEALTAEAPERARLYLERARDSVSTLSGQGEPSSSPRPAGEAFAADVSRSLPDAKSDGPSFVVALEASKSEGLSRVERAQLEAIGRLYRVYGRARLCVGGRPSHEVHLAAASRFLERKERLGERVERCDEETREPAYVRLRPGRGERG